MRPHRSVSSLRTWEGCPAFWQMKYIDKLPLGANAVMIRGRGVDRAVSLNLAQKIKSRIDLPLDVVTDAAAEEVEAGFAGNLYLTPAERSRGTKILRGETQDIAVSMTEHYHLVRAPFIKPTMVQERIRVSPRVASLEGIDLLGILDYATEDDIVPDLKTKEKPPREGEEHIDLQLTMYAVLYRSKTGRWPKAVAHDIILQERNKPPKHIYRESTRGPEDGKALVERIAVTEKAIQSGHFPPTDPSNWRCSEKWCPAWPICPYVAGQRRRQP